MLNPNIKPNKATHNINCHRTISFPFFPPPFSVLCSPLFSLLFSPPCSPLCSPLCSSHVILYVIPLFVPNFLLFYFSPYFLPYVLPLFPTYFLHRFLPYVLPSYPCCLIYFLPMFFPIFFPPMFFPNLCSTHFLPDILPYILAYFLSCFFQHVPCDFSPMLFLSVFHDFVLFSLPLCVIFFHYFLFHVFGAGHLRGSRLLSFSAFYYENNIVWGGGAGWGGVG